MSICLFVCVAVCVYMRLSVYPSVCLCVYVSVSLSLSLSEPFPPSVCLSVCLFISFCTFLPLSLCIFLSILSPSAAVSPSLSSISSLILPLYPLIEIMYFVVSSNPFWPSHLLFHPSSAMDLICGQGRGKSLTPCVQRNEC